jgi:hypothetical protein
MKHVDENEKYPVLQDLINSYFHQDYEDLTGTADDVIREYKEVAPLRDQQELIREIEVFLARYNSSGTNLTDNFVRVFRPIIHFYTEEGRTAEQSLRRIIELLEAPTQEPQR